MDIYPGESADIDIAARFDDEPECYVGVMKAIFLIHLGV